MESSKGTAYNRFVMCMKGKMLVKVNAKIFLGVSSANFRVININTGDGSCKIVFFGCVLSGDEQVFGFGMVEREIEITGFLLESFYCMLHVLSNDCQDWLVCPDAIVGSHPHS